MDLKTPLSALAGIGSSFAYKLRRLNLVTVEDLITHFPFRYDDFSQISSARQAQIDEKVTLIGEIWSIKNVYTRSRKVLTHAVFNDGTVPIELTWFNQSWLTKQIVVGDKLQISGKLTKYKNKFTVVAPVWEKLQSLQNPQVSIYSTPGVDTLHTGRLVPVYPETLGISSKWLRTKINQVLPQALIQIQDPLPDKIKDKMIKLTEALNLIHFPQNFQDIEKARERLSFDELFYIQLATLKARLQWKQKPTVRKFEIQDSKLKNFIDRLPFKLTSAQKRVTNEIISDLKRGVPMNRLVQGEVGSGKTVVAAIIIYLTYLNNLRSLYMAPTEILAFQHFSTISNLLEPLYIKVGIYTGSRKFTKELNFLPDVIIGTHALLSSSLEAEDVGVVIVDEQQRFGVEQRSLLRSKARVPHFLTMTATPIPRTVALTLYGDLDLSIIDELPKGRKEVKTYLVPSFKRSDAYKFIESHIKKGEQTYIITPLIEESETLVSAKAAKKEFERLKKEVFPHLRLGLLHGRLKSKEKEEVLNKFKDKEVDILVSTSVVEVGVDVTNATIMVIEGAERFGLSQLHQLRGRVGRGEKESFCLLFMGEEDSQTKQRLKHLEKTFDGLKLAELDLKIRGAGEIFGTKQSGRFDLKIASLSDISLIEKTREAAREILHQDPTLAKYPELKLKLESLGTGVMPD
ncbi:ATP-dependent DNA helicase RecG [Candidatus Daviesbacteria bacterium]|nr:ATP-dependent DNA helicase RecG [Candidatus Daviesbacteria bacterium]